MTYRLLLDTSSLTYRAFFALPTSITDGEGRPVNAVRGYCDMTARLVADRGPDEVVHVFDDDWRPAGRVAAYPGYKAARQDEPAELGAQFALLRRLLGLVGQRVVVAPGWEADDALGALCAQLGEAERVDVVTGDRDLLQLVDDARGVRVLFTVKGVSEVTEFDEAGVTEHYGVPARRYIDYATLRGDPSDGLPGVAGVGDKTARRLVEHYDSLDELLAAARRCAAGQTAAALTPKLAERLVAAGAYLEAMRAVVPVRTDVALAVDAGARDDAAADALAEAGNFDGPLRRLREVLDA